MSGNCEGVHEPDRVRPLQMCQQRQHWRSTTGERVYPLIQIKHDGKSLIVICGRRKAVEGEG